MPAATVSTSTMMDRIWPRHVASIAAVTGWVRVFVMTSPEMCGNVAVAFRMQALLSSARPGAVARSTVAAMIASLKRIGAPAFAEVEVDQFGFSPGSRIVAPIRGHDEGNGTSNQAAMFRGPLAMPSILFDAGKLSKKDSVAREITHDENRIAAKSGPLRFAHAGRGTGADRAHAIEINLPRYGDTRSNLRCDIASCCAALPCLAGIRIMKIMCRLALQWVGVAAIAIAIPQLASAYEADGAALKLAMGPTSAAMKNQGPSSTADKTVAKCDPSAGTCPKPRHRSRHRSTGSAVH